VGLDAAPVVGLEMIYAVIESAIVKREHIAPPARIPGLTTGQRVSMLFVSLPGPLFTAPKIRSITATANVILHFVMYERAYFN
jgi:hypothetical protein